MDGSTVPYIAMLGVQYILDIQTEKDTLQQSAGLVTCNTYAPQTVVIQSQPKTVLSKPLIKIFDGSKNNTSARV